jgi:ankyrin repeat protein
VRRLLDAGEDADLVSSGGSTALVAAAFKGHLSVVDLLATKGKANVDLAGDDGATPLLMAAQEGHLDVVELLLTKSNANVDLADVDGATPLCMAAHKGHVAVVELLVTKGMCNVDLARGDGATPLLMAAQSDHPVLRLLPSSAPLSRPKNFPCRVTDILPKRVRVQKRVKQQIDTMDRAAIRIHRARQEEQG